MRQQRSWGKRLTLFQMSRSSIFQQDEILINAVFTKIQITVITAALYR